MGINILILSVGTRNKIVRYFRKALTDQDGNRLGFVVATDTVSYTHLDVYKRQPA